MTLTYAQALDYMYGFFNYEQRTPSRYSTETYNLARVQAFMARLDDPQSRFRCIHIAGTKGKGSVAAMCESALRTAGYRVGLYTSPHLHDFRERIQVDRELIQEPELAALVERIQPAVADFPELTWFEIVTGIGFLHFVDRQVDIAVLEVGLGGRLDSTNIVTPQVSVLTSISYDHMAMLGNTLAEIATEKAGIIKPGVPVVTGVNEPEPLAVIEAAACQNGSALVRVGPAEMHAPPLDTVHLPLLGQHQRANAAVALAALRLLSPRIPIRADAIRSGLARVHWPGRLQLVTETSGRKILLDGAHNIGGAESLATALREYFPGTRPSLVLGILRDKDWPAMCEILAPLAERILLVPVHSERSAEPHGLAEVCQRANPEAQVSEYASLAAGLDETSADRFVVIAGSLYLIGEAMELLHLSTATPSDERGLNEWSGEKAASR